LRRQRQISNNLSVHRNNKTKGFEGVRWSSISSSSSHPPGCLNRRKEFFWI
jgi:hypothetical protein